MMLRVFAVTVLLLCVLVGNCVAGVRKEIQFKRGESTTTIDGYIGNRDRDRYYIMAKQGQILNVRITSANSSGIFHVYSPGYEEDGDLISGRSMEGARETNLARVSLVSSGMHLIDVGSQSGATKYRLTVSVEGGASLQSQSSLAILPEWLGCESTNLQDSSTTYLTYWYFDKSGRYSVRHSTIQGGRYREYPHTVRIFGRWRYGGNVLKTTEYAHQDEGAKGREAYKLLADYSSLTDAERRGARGTAISNRIQVLQREFLLSPTIVPLRSPEAATRRIVAANSPQFNFAMEGEATGASAEQCSALATRFDDTESGNAKRAVFDDMRSFLTRLPISMYGPTIGNSAATQTGEQPNIIRPRQDATAARTEQREPATTERAECVNEGSSAQQIAQQKMETYSRVLLQAKQRSCAQAEAIESRNGAWNLMAQAKQFGSAALYGGACNIFAQNTRLISRVCGL